MSYKKLWNKTKKYIFFKTVICKKKLFYRNKGVQQIANILQTRFWENDIGAWDERLMETQKKKKINSRNKYFEDINTEKGSLLL